MASPQVEEDAAEEELDLDPEDMFAYDAADVDDAMVSDADDKMGDMQSSDDGRRL